MCKIQNVHTSGTVGQVISFSGANAPAGTLLCYGQSLLVADYPALFSVIGYTYGGAGANFNLPDLRGRTVVGKDNMGGSAANRITSGGSGIAGTTLGAAGGAETHTISVAQMPSHNHGGGSHTHGYTAPNRTTAEDGNPGIGLVAGAYNGRPLIDKLSTSTGGESTTVVASQGSGNAHNNTQPSMVKNFCIVYK